LLEEEVDDSAFHDWVAQDAASVSQLATWEGSILFEDASNFK